MSRQKTERSQKVAAPPIPDVVRLSRSSWMRFCYGVLAVICIVLAIIGAILPGMPTTVFLLAAAWAAARCSPRLYAWLWHHPLLGPSLWNWHAGRKVSRRAKWMAGICMSLSAVVMFYNIPQTWLAVTLTLIMLCVLVWLVRRPEPSAD